MSTHTLASLVLGAVCWSSNALLADGIAAPLPNSPQSEVEQIRLERLNDATEVAIFSPVVSWSPTSDTTLYLLNTFTDSLSVDVSFLPTTGAPVNLGPVVVEPNRHMALSLKAILGRQRPIASEGSIRVSFHGDTNMLQSWAILRRFDQTLEVRLTSPLSTTDLHLLSFWDTTRSLGSAAPRYYLLNTSSASVSLSISEGSSNVDAGSSQVLRKTVILQPASRTVLSARNTTGRGWIRIDADVSAGALSAVGLVEGLTRVSMLPLQAAPEPEARISSLPFDVGTPLGLWPNSTVNVFNSSPELSHVSIQLLSPVGGAVLASAAFSLAPSEVHTLDLRRDFWQAFARNIAGEARVVVSADTGVMLSGYTEVPPGAPVDMVFAPEDYAHQNGTYPIPAPAGFDVYTDFVNVTTEPARIRGQLSWEGGTYSLVPFVVDPGSSYRLHYSDLATSAPPDLLGRTVPLNFEHGFFQWSAHGSGGMLLARTHVRPRSGSDSWGFNCFGCCWEIPQGLFIPSSVSFDIGANPQLQASELDNTCTGPLGPFPAELPSLTYHSPVTLTGSNASSTGYTSQTVSFASPAAKVSLICVSSNVTIRGTAPVVVDQCYKDKHPGGKVGVACTLQTGDCAACYECCENDKEVADCRCEKIGQECKNTAASACGTCKQLCLGAFIETCNSQVTTCQP